MDEPNGLLRMWRAVFGSGLTSTEKLVLLAIVDHWSRDSPQPWPPVSRLQHWTGFSRRAVLSALGSLERKEALTVIRKPGIGNAYDLTAVCAERLPVHELHPCTTSTRAPDAPDPCTTSTPPVHDVLPKEPKKGTKKEPSESTRGEGRPNRGPRKPGTKLPELPLPSDWVPSDAHRAFAAEHGIDLELELVKFRGWAEGKLAASWNGRFTTWLGNAAGYKRERAQRTPVQQGRYQPPTVPKGVVDADRF